MDYFSGLTFALAGSSPENRVHTANVPTYYGVQYNHAGRLRLRVDDGSECCVTGPHVFFTHPGAFFDYGPPPGETRHHSFICVCGARVQQYIQSGLIEPGRQPPLVPIPDPDKFLLTMLEIIRLVRGAAVVPPRAVLRYEELLLQIHEASNPPRRLPPFQYETLLALVDGIRKNPGLPRDFDAVCARLAVTPTHFRRLFKTVAGLPPAQFLIHIRIQAAARRLLESSDSLAVIASELGFANQFYFSRLFKDRYHVPPLEYRREFKGIAENIT